MGDRQTVTLITILDIIMAWQPGEDMAEKTYTRVSDLEGRWCAAPDRHPLGPGTPPLHYRTYAEHTL